MIAEKIAGWIIDRQYKAILARLEGNTMQKLDVFLMADRITVEEYQELVELMNGGTANE